MTVRLCMYVSLCVCLCLCVVYVCECVGAGVTALFVRVCRWYVLIYCVGSSLLRQLSHCLDNDNNVVIFQCTIITVASTILESTCRQT